MKLPFFPCTCSSSSICTSPTINHGNPNPRNSDSPPSILPRALSLPTNHRGRNKKLEQQPDATCAGCTCENPNSLQNPNNSTKSPTTTPSTLRHSHSSPASSPFSSYFSAKLPPLNPNLNTFGNPKTNSGAITRHQLEAVLRRLGGGSEEEDEDVASMLRCMEGFDLDDPASLRSGAEGEEEEEMRAVFRFFDGDGDGRISAEELREALATVGDGGPCSVDDCRRMIATVDSTGGGFVCFSDFARMMIDVQGSL